MTSAAAEPQALRPLSMREQLFVEHFIEAKLPGYECARAAGYKGSDAVMRVQASRLLTRANVRAAIRVGSLTRAQENGGTIMTREERELMLSNMAQARGEFAGKIELPLRVRALELLARMNGDFATVLIPGMRNGNGALPVEQQPAIEGEVVPEREATVVNIYLPANGR